MSPKEDVVAFLKKLQQDIIACFENFEHEKRFEKTPWTHPYGGGGEMAVLRGDVFEKAAVNFSAVSGEQFPMADGIGPFFATGVSLITHMKNPHAPTVHMNVRYIETPNSSWVAGGYDLTPMGIEYEEDKEHFHRVAKKTLRPFGEDLYSKYSAWAKEYFFIPHRKKERGVGGIFFDHVKSPHFEKDFELIQKVGYSLIEAIIPIYEKRTPLPYSDQDKEKQYALRAHYVEFNLLYDRGTKFGFLSHGNPEAILCSMPPLAKW